MKPIRIFGLPAHTFKDRTSGVDFLRIIQPLKHLNGFKTDRHEFITKVYDPRTDDSFDWRDVFNDYDIVYFNYTTNDVGYAVMGTLAQKYKKKLVVDMDDALWDIRKDNVAYDVFKEDAWGRKVITAVVGDVHFATTTNDYLKNVMIHNTKKTHDKIAVFPNYIDLDFYAHRAKEKNTNNIKIGHFGSTSHFQNIRSGEFIKALSRLMYEYPNITFTTIGSFFSEFKTKWGHRYEQAFGDQDVTKWVKEKLPVFADDIDFFVTPVEVNTYNLSKSGTKYNEISSTQRPGCYQNIRQYQEVVTHGTDGFLCSDEHDWYTSMKRLIDSHELRRDMGIKAYQKVSDRYTIQQNVHKYARFFEMVLDSK